MAHSKVIVDYMVIEHQLAQDVINPRTMEGYMYIFDGEMELSNILPTAPEYRVELKEVPNDILITIDSVWRWIDSHSLNPNKTADILKDTALSFTLFKLLKRRFCGYRPSEAGLEKTLDLVLHGLLANNGSYARAFRLIEEELSFLYDFFYTRMELAAASWLLATVVISTVIICNCISKAFSKHYVQKNEYPHASWDSPWWEADL